MQKQRLILIMGVVLALIAVFLTKVYLDQMDQERRRIIEEEKKKLANLRADQVAVLVAKKDIPRGAVVEPESLEVSLIPKQFVQPQAITSLDRIDGMIVVAPITKGEQVTLSKLSHPRQRGGLAEATPVGKRAITISVDNIASLAGMIKPGDYVDVIAMVSVPVQTPDGKTTSQGAVLPLFQNVLVLAIGQNTGAIPRAEGGRYKQEERVEVSPLITLALTPQEASLIAFVQEQGRIRLVLRSPADSQVQPVQPASWETLFQYIMPQPGVKPVEPAEPKVRAEVSDYVEIYRGLNKEKVPLSK